MRCVPVHAGFVQFSVLQQVLFQTSLPIQQWAGHLLSLSQSAAKPVSCTEWRPCGPSTGFMYGNAAVAAQAARLLESFWHHAKPSSMKGPADALFVPVHPVDWLSSLNDSLPAIKAAFKASTPNSAALAAAGISNEVNMVLGALLPHPDVAVQCKAVEVMCAVVDTFPFTGLSFLPMLLFQLQRSGSGTFVGLHCSMAYHISCILYATPI